MNGSYRSTRPAGRLGRAFQAATAVAVIRESLREPSDFIDCAPEEMVNGARLAGGHPVQRRKWLRYLEERYGW